MVKRNLAKVETAGPSPVVRSRVRYVDLYGGLAKRLGSGLQSRIDEFDSRTHLEDCPHWAAGAEGARFPDTEEVAGSIPASPTTRSPEQFGLLFIRAISAAVSALRSHRRGHWFDSSIAHPFLHDSFSLSVSFLFLDGAC